MRISCSFSQRGWLASLVDITYIKMVLGVQNAPNSSQLSNSFKVAWCALYCAYMCTAPKVTECDIKPSTLTFNFTIFVENYGYNGDLNKPYNGTAGI